MARKIHAQCSCYWASVFTNIEYPFFILGIQAKLLSPVLMFAVLLFPHVGRDLDKTTASFLSLISRQSALPRDRWGRRRGRVCFQCKRRQLTSLPSPWRSGDAWQRCTVRELHWCMLSGGADLCLGGWGHGVVMATTKTA